MVVVYKGFLEEQSYFKGMFNDEIQLGRSRADSWARMILGEEGSLIITTRVGREVNTDELVELAHRYCNIVCNPERFGYLLEQRKSGDNILYELPAHIARKYGYPPGTAILIPRYWRTLVGIGDGENAGVSYIGNDPIRSLKIKNESLK